MRGSITVSFFLPTSNPIHFVLPTIQTVYCHYVDNLLVSKHKKVPALEGGTFLVQAFSLASWTVSVNF